MYARGRSLALVTMLALAVGACGNDSTGSGDGGKPPEGDIALSGNISTNMTLDASMVYVIQGIVSVEDGATLTIPAGTKIVGSTSIVPSALLVRKGGRLVSNGTAANPVVFTSGKPAGSRARGDWGGVVLNGRSICNFLSLGASNCVSEGASGEYGEDPPVTDDDSGTLTYTRVEYAGYEASFGNELNALTLNAVGSGTTIHHVQLHYGLDDGVELFGGTVDLKYILSTGNSDDSFDYSTGWAGRGQFWIAQHDPNDADTGFEVDGNEEDYTATPYTDPLIYNVTLVGRGATGTTGESTTGMVLRRGTDGDIYNAIVMGFSVAGVDFDNAETETHGATLNNTIFFDNAVDVSADTGDGIDDATYLGTMAGIVLDTDPELEDPYNRTDPDFRPTPGGLATTAARATPPSDGFFSAVNFIGGADPAETTPWYTGWTTTDQS